MDSAPDANSCGAGALIHYAAPGCGTDAVPICASVADASFSPSSYCACDGVTTLTYDARGVRSPYLYAGACKQDGGSSAPDAGCACVLSSPLTWSTTSWDCYCGVHDCTTSLAAFTASLSSYTWSSDDYANCDLRVISFKLPGVTDMPSTRTFAISSGKMVGAFDTADTGVRCPFDPGDALGGLLGLVAGTPIDTSCVKSASSCSREAGASGCFSTPPTAVFCQLSDGRRIEAGATFADVDGCNCCYCSQDGRAICQAAACLWPDGGGGLPIACQTDQDCVAQGRRFCVFEAG